MNLNGDVYEVNGHFREMVGNRAVICTLPLLVTNIFSLQ